MIVVSKSGMGWMILSEKPQCRNQNQVQKLKLKLCVSYLFDLVNVNSIAYSNEEKANEIFQHTFR